MLNTERHCSENESESESELYRVLTGKNLASQIGQVCATCFKTAWQVREGSPQSRLKSNAMENFGGNIWKLFSSY